MNRRYASMITLGIDLSSMPEGTAACLINWKRNQAVVAPPAVGCTDDKLDALISEADVIGIDAPFGWPEDFVSAVADWTAESWSKEGRNRFQFRTTDRAVRDQVKRWPLSVSTDRIALPAMRAMALLRRHGVTDRSGDGQFFEVYPAGSLFCWNLRCRGYKRIDAECTGFRREILGELRAKLSWLDVSETYVDSSDTLDALIASLTVRAAAQGLTSKPTTGQAVLARREGWIHLPKEFPGL
jgi:predicted nuclease with RNAse H fold